MHGTSAGRGILELSFVAGQTAVTRAQAGSPLKLFVPGSRGPSAWAYTSSLGGGLLAGDEISLTIRAGALTRGFVSTQASTKIYRNPHGLPCRHDINATVAENAVLIVAPDPVQCFAGSLYEQRQRFELHPSAGLVVVDSLISGRHARGERWASTRYRSRIDIGCGDEHLLADDPWERKW